MVLKMEDSPWIHLTQDIMSRDMHDLEQKIDTEWDLKKYSSASVFAQEDTTDDSQTSSIDNLFTIATTTLHLQAQLQSIENQLHLWQQWSWVIQQTVVNQLNQLSTQNHDLEASQRQLESKLLDYLVNEKDTTFHWGKVSDESPDSVVDMQRQLQHAASSQEYQTLLREIVATRHCWVVPLTSPTPSRNRRSPVLGDLGDQVQEVQDGKDLQRDEICINGQVVQGSVVGYAGIVRLFVENLRKIHAQLWPHHVSSQPTTHEEFERLAKRALHLANRTQSGGSTYEVLDRTLRHADFSLVRPHSSCPTTPLAIMIEPGAYRVNLHDDNDDDDDDENHPSSSPRHHWAMGTRVTIEATGHYLLCDAQDPTIEFHSVKAVYSTHLALSLSTSPYSRRGTPRCARLDAGQVTLELY